MSSSTPGSPGVLSFVQEAKIIVYFSSNVLITQPSISMSLRGAARKGGDVAISSTGEQISKKPINMVY